MNVDLWHCFSSNQHHLKAASKGYGTCQRPRIAQAFQLQKCTTISWTYRGSWLLGQQWEERRRIYVLCRGKLAPFWKWGGYTNFQTGHYFKHRWFNTYCDRQDQGKAQAGTVLNGRICTDKNGRSKFLTGTNFHLINQQGEKKKIEKANQNPTASWELVKGESCLLGKSQLWQWNTSTCQPWQESLVNFPNYNFQQITVRLVIDSTLHR